MNKKATKDDSNHPNSIDYKVEYYTPPEVIEPVRRAFGCNPSLDPASNQLANDNLIKAKQFFSKQDNGLTKDWRAYVKNIETEWMWINPPFGKANILAFFDKIMLHNIRTCLLLPNNPETEYYQKIASCSNFFYLMQRRPTYIIENGKRHPDPPKKGATLFFLNIDQFQEEALIDGVRSSFSLNQNIQSDFVSAKPVRKYNHHRGLLLKEF